MIVEAIVLSAASIIVSSFWFVDRILKRDYQDGFLDISGRIDKETMEDVNAAIGEPEVKPFLDISVGVLCPICQYGAKKDIGLRVPQACHVPEECPIKRRHLHAECTACQSKWLMETAEKK